MKKIQAYRLLIGLFLTFAVTALAVVLRHVVKLNSGFFTSTFLSAPIILLLSIVLIVAFRRQLNFRLSMPTFKQVWKPFLVGLLTSIAVSLFTGILTLVFHGRAEVHPAFVGATVLQFVFFTLILTPVAEELLFRGFLLNYLKPLDGKGVKLFGRNISLRVLVTALVFSLCHLGLLASGVGTVFMIRTLVFAFIIGTIAGYYQEKYDNIVPAIIVHMAGNFMGLFSVIIMNYHGS